MHSALNRQVGIQGISFFFGSRAKFYCRITHTLWVEWKTVSDFYWLKTPPIPSVAAVARYAVSSLNGSAAGREIWVWAAIVEIMQTQGFFVKKVKRKPQKRG